MLEDAVKTHRNAQNQFGRAEQIAEFKLAAQLVSTVA